MTDGFEVGARGVVDATFEDAVTTVEAMRLGREIDARW